MYTKRDAQPTDVRVKMRDGEGQAVIRKLSENLPEKARLFARITLEPGCSIGYHVHENETEMFYFASGTARVRDDEEVLTLTAGDALTTCSGHGHSVENIGSDALELVAVIVKD